ncbi:hypothetical protein Cni_G00547 [Canna indica]|uniref:RRM domain-containing protein n=1 Tax=Canna indica TaxID=4628 RepID=A0AAQ3JMY0_9LILI|nr:hypothetical protein Cni_G00547 [Canna indica]
MEVGSLNMEDGAPFKSDLDLNSHENKDEEETKSSEDDNKKVENMQVYADQERPRSPILPVSVDNEGLQSTLLSSCTTSSSPIDKVEEVDEHLPPGSDIVDNTENKSFVNSTEEPSSNVEDHECHDEKQETTYSIQCSDLDSGVDQTVKDKKILRDSDPYINSPVVSVDNNMKSQSEKSKFDDGTEDRNFNNMEMKDDDHIIGDANLDDVDTLKESSVGLLLPAQKGTPSLSPSPERELSAHMERSPDNKPSSVHEQLPTEIIERKTASSPDHVPSSENLAVGRKRPRDSFSPPARRKSPPGKTTHQDAHRRDKESSPRKNIAASPRRRESPRRRQSPRKRESPRRRDRSKSRSPVRRKDASGHKRDHRRRSRSRSPHARDHPRRSPRRRLSPGRRSSPPSYHSRHRSPRRPWSPPSNRNTGVGKPGRNLFVAGFSYVTTERDLEKKFSRFGRVTDVRIVRDRRSGDSRGFGFLSLERDEDADAAIRALDQTEWNGRIVLVEKSKTSAR